MPDLLKNDRTMKRLAALLEQNHRDWKRLMERRRGYVQHMVGRHHGLGGSEAPVPIPALNMARSTYAHRMVNANPRVLASTEHQQMRSMASATESAINHRIGELNMVDSFQQCHYEAMLFIGCMKTGREVGPMFEFDGEPGHVGGAFAESVEAEDLLLPVKARKITELHVIGDRYRVPLEETKQNEFYDESARKQLEAIDFRPDAEASASTVTSGSSTMDPLFDEVLLADLYFPRQRVIATVPIDESWNIRGPVLREDYFNGPENPLGPYRLLRFDPIPGSVIPLAPIALWFDMADALNQVFRKLIRQSLRQKDITTYRSASEEDVQRIVDSSDGQVVQADDPGGITPMKFGGIDAASLAFFMQLLNRFSWMTGNLDVLGGLSPQAGTARQENLLNENASVQVAAMQARFVNFMQDVLKDLAWHVWNDQLYDPPLYREAPGVPEVRARMSFDAAARIGDILDYDIRIEPYSWQRRGPQEKLAAMMQVWQTIIIPILPMVQGQGIIPNVEGLLKMAAKYLDMQELGDMVTFTGGEPEQQPRSAAAGGRVPGGTRHTISERRSAPYSTRGAQDNEMMQMMRMVNSGRGAA